MPRKSAATLHREKAVKKIFGGLLLYREIPTKSEVHIEIEGNSIEAAELAQLIFIFGGSITFTGRQACPGYGDYQLNEPTGEIYIRNAFLAKEYG